MAIRLCLAGATGWAGSALARATAATQDIELVAAVSRKGAGRILGDVLGEPRLTCPVYATADEALKQSCDVFFEFTRPEQAKSHVLSALGCRANVVIGTSGLTDSDYTEIAALAERKQCGVLAVGNFALSVVLLQKFAEVAARYVPHWEIVDYASDNKPDAPSGTALELAHRLSRVRPSELAFPLEQTQGIVAARGARINESQIHSVRLPSYSISLEITFGLPDERLTLRHDSGVSAVPYVGGELLAIRGVGTFVGLRRGLDSVLDLALT